MVLAVAGHGGNPQTAVGNSTVFRLRFKGVGGHARRQMEWADDCSFTLPHGTGATVRQGMA